MGPRSNAYKSDGTTPTAFGELYFAWDGDATIRSDKAYFLHNKAERKRLQNAAGSSGPGELSIRNGGSAAQWVLRPTGTDGLWYITSLRDGRRLRYTGSALNFAAANTTGPAVQWSVLEDQHGWFYVENPAAPATARRLRDLGGAFGMVSSTSTGDNVKWRFIVPYALVETSAPPPLTNLTATAGDTQVSLSWTPSSSSDLAFYNVYRSTVNGGPYTLIASNLTGASYTNTALQNGTRYYYVVTATDLTGFESELSTQFVVTPVIATPPTALVAARSGSTLTITWPASHLGWILETQANGLAADQWSAIPESTTATSYVMSLMPGAPRTFFRLRRP